MSQTRAARAKWSVDSFRVDGHLFPPPNGILSGVYERHSLRASPLGLKTEGCTTLNRGHERHLVATHANYNPSAINAVVFMMALEQGQHYRLGEDVTQRLCVATA